MTRQATTPIAAAVTGGLHANLLRRLERFERRLIAAAKRQHTETMTEIATARGSLYPFGKPQERSLNFVPLLARYGAPLQEEMRREAERHATRLLGVSPISQSEQAAVGVRGET